MGELTFRDFAGALMGGDAAKAAAVLSTLLGVDAAIAEAATAHFQAQMTADPAFAGKAMGMRQVVERRDEAGLIALLKDCFGLADDTAATAAKTVMSRY